MGTERMGTVTRSPLAALVCALAGPMAAWAAAVLLGPVIVGASVDLTPGADLVTQLGDTIVGLVVGTLVIGALMTLVGVVATLAALILTRCPRPAIAMLACVVLTPLWVQVLELFSLGFTAWLVCLGLAPGAVRAAFELLRSPAEADSGGGALVA